jgi:hypothetical protein
VTEEVEGKRNPRVAPENNKKRKETSSTFGKKERKTSSFSTKQAETLRSDYLRDVSADRP